MFFTSKFQLKVVRMRWIFDNWNSMHKTQNKNLKQYDIQAIKLSNKQINFDFFPYWSPIVAASVSILIWE